MVFRKIVNLSLKFLFSLSQIKFLLYRANALKVAKALTIFLDRYNRLLQPLGPWHSEPNQQWAFYYNESTDSLLSSCTMPILEYLQVYAKDNCFNKVVRLV